MTPRRLVVAGNWKMNTTPSEGTDLARAVVQRLGEVSAWGVKVVLCPPATHLAAVGTVLEGTAVELGAQNVHWEPKGAFTGEVSAVMLRAVGCRWVIVGHSERRRWFGETDQTVNRRARAALDQGLCPIICVGETWEERQRGATLEVLERQLRAGLKDFSLEARFVVAYEPVWAIGTGHNATPEQAEEAHAFIRCTLSSMSSAWADTTVQYGGSVTADNARELMICPNVDGALVGGASLSAESFTAIVQAAAAKPAQ